MNFWIILISSMALVTVSSAFCTPSLHTLTNRFTQKGKHMPNYKTLDSCQMACEEDTSCLAMDFYIRDDICNLHFTPDTFDFIYFQVGWVHSRKILCSENVVRWSDDDCNNPLWYNFDHHVSSAAKCEEDYKQYDSVDACQSFCIAYSQCVAINFYKTSKRCCIITDIKSWWSGGLTTSTAALYRVLIRCVASQPKSLTRKPTTCGLDARICNVQIGCCSPDFVCRYYSQEAFRAKDQTICLPCSRRADICFEDSHCCGNMKCYGANRPGIGGICGARTKIIMYEVYN